MQTQMTLVEALLGGLIEHQLNAKLKGAETFVLSVRREFEANEQLRDGGIVTREDQIDLKGRGILQGVDATEKTESTRDIRRFHEHVRTVVLQQRAQFALDGHFTDDVVVSIGSKER